MASVVKTNSSLERFDSTLEVLYLDAHRGDGEHKIPQTIFPDNFDPHLPGILEKTWLTLSPGFSTRVHLCEV
jgi:hypothetical protein